MNASDLRISQEKIASVHDELVRGLRDYMREHAFTTVVLGLSGGIDSSVTCCLAKEAAGEKNVLGLFMPSRYSSKESEEYARRLAGKVDIEFRVIPLARIYDSYLEVLGKDLSVDEKGDVEVYLQNIQARIRGNILMAFSNRFGHLVLATGNKSEAMMGYCTLYGDTVGGIAVLADVFKTTVYQLAGYINREKEVIPAPVIERHPTAELKPGQRDQDSLPPYEILDGILYHLGKGRSPDELVRKGFSAETIREVEETIKRTEYKRRQCPPGIKVSTEF
ncbi:MAG: NAD(+) synthase [Candidatus Omnitrophota bacterium]|nr:NAD(+) synthase [Candidatus Omnitrophota bacterium]